MEDVETRARKAAIQRRYAQRKAECATPDEIEAKRIKQREWSRRWRKRNPEKVKAVLKASRAKTYDTKRNSEQCRAARAKHGAKWNAGRRARRSSDPEYAECLRKAARAKYKATCGPDTLAKLRAKRAADPQKGRDICRRWRQKNPDKHRANAKLWAAANPERAKANRIAWRKQNPQYTRNRYASDVEFQIVRRLRSRLTRALERASVRKSAGTVELLGCSGAEARTHIEAQFLDGMSWQNCGEWHIDHIRPVCTFDLKDPDQQREAFHFSNLRPLWAVDNLARPRRLWAAAERMMT